MSGRALNQILSSRDPVNGTQISPFRLQHEDGACTACARCSVISLARDTSPGAIWHDGGCDDQWETTASPYCFGQIDFPGGGWGRAKAGGCVVAVVWDNTPSPSSEWAHAQSTLGRPSSPRSTRATHAESLPEQWHHRLADEWLSAPLWPPPCGSKRLLSRPRPARASLDSILFATRAPSIGFIGSTAGQSDPPLREDRLRSVPPLRGGARRSAGWQRRPVSILTDSAHTHCPISAGPKICTRP